MKEPRQSSKQMSFASYEYAHKKRVTRREKFLGEMDQVVQGPGLHELIASSSEPTC